MRVIVMTERYVNKYALPSPYSIRRSLVKKSKHMAVTRPHHFASQTHENRTVSCFAGKPQFVHKTITELRENKYLPRVAPLPLFLSKTQPALPLGVAGFFYASTKYPKFVVIPSQ